MPVNLPPAIKRVDLHLHSTASDGSLPPAEVVRLAHQKQVDVIALCDHDCTDGIAEAQTAAASLGVTVLPGVEISTMHAGREVHLLGYCFDAAYAPLQAQLAAMRGERRTRAEKMVAKLAALGLPVSLARVLELGGEGSVGRPHIAQAMLEAGHVASLKEAFDRYLGDGGPAYVARARLSLPQAIALLHEAGGAAVLAHPVYVPDYLALIPELARQGLDGVEVFYPDHSAGLIHKLKGLARGYDLVMTGGSDFHRPEKDGTAVLGTVAIPPDCARQVAARAEKYPAATQP